MRYLEESYDCLVQRSFYYAGYKQVKSSAWDLVRVLYDKNYLHCVDDTSVIPKKIHQIWFGGKLPDKYKRLTESWQRFHPTWEYKLWKDEDIDSISLTKKDIFDASPNYANKSDIFRYEILRQQGGLYADTDFECLKSFDDLLCLDFFTGWAYDKSMILYTALIATIPRHQIINDCVNLLNHSYNGNNSFKIMDTTGPYYFTRCFLNSAREDTKGVVVFPPDFFYPLPNGDRWATRPHKYIKPFSYAIHHWAVSWLIKK